MNPESDTDMCNSMSIHQAFSALLSFFFKALSFIVLFYIFSQFELRIFIKK